MNITLTSTVSAEANGGSAAYTRWLGNHLAASGNQVRGVSRLRKDNGHALNHDLCDVGQPWRPESTALNGWETILVAPRTWTRPLLRFMVNLLSRRFTRSLAIKIYNLSYGSAVRRALPESCEIVHHTGVGWDLLGFCALSAARNRRAAFTVTPFVHPGQWGDSGPDVRLYNAADAVFVCSDYERDHLISRGVSPARLKRTGMAPATNFQGNAATFRNKHSLGSRPLILFLARKQAYKGYHALLSAMRLVLKEFPDACLIVAGEDKEPPYPELPAQNLLDLGSLGSKPAEAQEKADALAACDVFCMPSMAEAFGLVYAEAWAYGKPVIGGMAPALGELILEGQNGFRVPQDPEAIAAKLVLLLGNRSLRERLGAAGQALQQERFNWSAVTARHLEVWQSIRSAQNAN